MLLKLRNFMSYQELNQTWPTGKVILLTGPNASGKSTILDSVIWAMQGVARGYTKQNETVALKGDPGKPISVSIETHATWGNWPRAIQRASKLTILPADVAENFKAHADRYIQILGSWSLVSAKDADRATLMNVICRAGATDEVIISQLGKVCSAPPVAKYNETEWNGFGDVATALKKAEEIRRSYAAAKTATVPPEMNERLTAMKEELANLPTVEKPAACASTMSQAEVDNLQTKILGDHSRAKFLEGHLTELMSRLASWAPAKDIVEKYQHEVCSTSIASLDRELQDLNKRWDQQRGTVEEFDTATKEFDGNFKKREKLTKQIAQLEADIASISENSGNATARWNNWDKVVKALAPDGTVAAAVMEQAAAGLDRDRLEWAGKILGVNITLGNDGAITVAARSKNLASHGQNLLAGLALQDALCMAAGVPLMLVDELECLAGDNLAAALKFLGGIASDYEAILACHTGPKLNGLGDSFLQFTCGGGLLR